MKKIFLILSFIFLLHYAIVGQAVYGDGKFYWAYLRSAWKDHNLDLRNELNREYSPMANNKLQEKPFEKKQIFNWLPIGASISWLPAFVIADMLVNGLHQVYPSFPNNGYSDIYQIIVGLENVLFVSIGVIMIYRLLTNYFNPFISVLTVILALFGTNLLFYGGVDVINSHPASFLLSSLYLFFWIKTRKKRKKKEWILLGFLLGFMTMVRTQDAVFGSLLLFDFIFQKEPLHKKVLYMMITGTTFLITFFPQMLMWKYVFGNYFVSPYFLGGFNFFHPRILEVLFNARTGLFIWTPLYILCFVGLFIIRRRFFPLIVVSLLQLYLIMSWSGWDQGASFGIRMIITGLPYLSFGLAAVLSKLKLLLRPALFYTVYAGFIVYNVMSIFIFLLVK